MRKPQVLVFIDWYAPYFKAGGPVRSLVNLVEHLGAQVQFHVVTGDRDYMATTNEAGVPIDRWTTAEAGERVYHASPAGRSWAVWRRLIESGEWDVVYINGLYSLWSTIVPLWLLRGSGVRRIVAVRGMLAKGPMRQGGLKKRAFLTAMKWLGAFKGVEFQATNDEEAGDIRRWFGAGATVHLVQNLARQPESRPPAPLSKRVGEVRLVSFGRIAEEKNTLFAIERLARVKGKVHFTLYGTVYDKDYHARCQRAIATLPPATVVEWHGQLSPERVADALREAHFLYMPSVGENFGHAMLEALTAGRPLLISDRTPWKGLLAANAGWDLPLEHPEGFEAALQQAVDMDQRTYDERVRGAYAMGSRYLNDPAPVQRSFRMFRP
jgi:glycosyltransferase involved in cell wall biosynthesis